MNMFRINKRLEICRDNVANVSLVAVGHPLMTVGHLTSIGRWSSFSCPSTISLVFLLSLATVTILLRLSIFSSHLTTIPSRVRWPSSLAFVGHLSRVHRPSLSRPVYHLLLVRSLPSSSRPSTISFIVSIFSGARYSSFCHQAAYQFH